MSETRSPRRRLSGALPLLYWLFSVLLWEITLHLVSYRSFTGFSGYIFPFSVVFALLLTALSALFSQKANRILTLVLTIVLYVLFASQLVFNRVFGTFYSVSLMKLGGDAVKSFWKETLLTIASSWWLLLLMLLPLALDLIRGKKLPDSYRRPGWLSVGLCALSAVLLWVGTILSLRIGGTGYFTAYDFYHNNNTQTEQSVNCFGVITTMRLEIQHQLFSGGEQEDTLDDFGEDELDLPALESEPLADDASTQNQPSDVNAEANAPAETEPQLDTSPNILNLDFGKLDANTRDKDILELNKYFSNQQGTEKNQFTGMFKGYNLIEICAESYSPAFVSEELTPALYRLTHEGIVFTNYYTSYPNTTTNCEYSLSMGLFPDLSRSKYDNSFMVSSENYLPFCLGNLFQRLGYQTLAFHNYVGDYFGRDKSHPNMGYTCYFANDGMTFTTDWPASDLEMMEQSLPYIYEAGEPFVAYYMTFSGHYRYDFYSNPMCVRNKEATDDMDLPEACRAYIACNLELEYAMEYLLDELEAHDMLDHTVIVLTGDHYPYGLSEWEYEQLLGQELQTPFDKMKNSFVCWAAGMENPTVCSNYCCNIDILPTILNLFGADYDSRLLAGTDVLSNGRHMAILTDQSFMTDKLMFDASTNKITWFVSEDSVAPKYFDLMVQAVKNKMLISSKILYTDYYDYVFHECEQKLDKDAKATDSPGQIVE